MINSNVHKELCTNLSITIYLRKEENLRRRSGLTTKSKTLPQGKRVVEESTQRLINIGQSRKQTTGQAGKNVDKKQKEDFLSKSN